MLTFNDYVLLEKSSYPTWVKATSLLITARIRNLSNQIQLEKNLEKKLNLIAKQNNLLAYLGTLGLAIDTGDVSLLGTKPN